MAIIFTLPNTHVWLIKCLEWLRPAGLNPEFSGILAWPSDDGYGSTTNFVWLCANNDYQNGVCAPVFLVPHLTVYSKLQYFDNQYTQNWASTDMGSRAKRDLLVSPGEKFVSALFPFYGLIAQEHYLDNMHIWLENLRILNNNAIWESRSSNDFTEPYGFRYNLCRKVRTVWSYCHIRMLYVLAVYWFKSIQCGKT